MGSNFLNQSFIYEGLNTDVLDTKVIDFGDVVLLNKLWEHLDLTCIINKYAIKSAIMVINRCVYPQSKAMIRDWYENTILPELMNIPPNKIYCKTLTKCLDYLPEGVQDKIDFQSLKSKKTRFYMTLLQQLPEYGYSRDGRPDKKQVNISLVITKDGAFPIFHSTFNGSIPDKKRVTPMLKRLKEQGIKNSLLIIDRGLTDKKNRIKIIKDKQDYLTFETFQYISEEIKTNNDCVHGLEISEELRHLNSKYSCLASDKERIFLYHNQEKAKLQRIKREEKLDQAEVEIKSLKLNQGKLKTKSSIEKRINKILKSNRVKKYFKFKVVGKLGSFDVSLERNFEELKNLP